MIFPRIGGAGQGSRLLAALRKARQRCSPRLSLSLSLSQAKGSWTWRIGPRFQCIGSGPSPAVGYLRRQLSGQAQAQVRRQRPRQVTRVMAPASASEQAVSMPFFTGSAGAGVHPLAMRQLEGSFGAAKVKLASQWAEAEADFCC